MDESKTEIASYLENASLFLLGLLLLIFPFFLLTLTTDAFILPKQILLGAVVLIILVVFGIKSLSKGQVILRRTPFDLPILLFTLSLLTSSIFAVNRADALISFVPLLFSVLAFFAIVNTAKDKNSALLLITSLLTGAGIVSILSLLSFLKIYILPFAFTKSQTFSPLGSLLDQALYLLLVLPLAVYLALPLLSKRKSEDPSAVTHADLSGHEKKGSPVPFTAGTVIIIVGLLISAYLLFKTPSQNGGFLTLPFETGFQTSFAAISQDTGRVVQGFFLGSGYGTYVTDFTRFKQPVFNQNPNLWALTFFRSSSFILELLATTGILGALLFIFLIYKIFKVRFVFILFLVPIIASFLLPFSFSVLALFFILLGIVSSLRANSPKGESEGFFDVELQLVALQKGLIAFDTSLSRGKKSVLPSIILTLILILVGLIGYFGGKYVISDTLFQESLIAASQNNGTLTYQKQARSISTFPYRDAYYRIFSQTNLALANSLAAQQPANSSPSAQTQQTIFTLIQQSINAGRAAVTYAPQTMLNWQNLASIYRSLIGFGQNADNFAILANQQAIILDPNNPQEYINLGGIYYQLGQWDNAIRQFQIAAALKPDLANAYYNLGHALQEKGDLTDAMTQYEIVGRIVANDRPNLDKISKEIEDLKKRIAGTTAQGPTPSSEQPLGISSPESQLPPQNPPVKIPPPIEATKSSRR
ncbi:MAG: hypothetical protein A3B44_02525 [Candidatus Levybacteria bacterium RIFCSPLOWO2_01_FULL_38_21]|nr:MAG: hypothetical protein A3B44_02525 [Candidatus Levybacteria bacterium RIFCSPLOWO2_01_FULL_38_21]